MLAITIRHDLEQEMRAKQVGETLHELYGAIMEREAALSQSVNLSSISLAAGAGSVTAAARLESAHMHLAEICHRLHRALADLIKTQKEALAFESARLLPWVSRIFDKRLAEHAMQKLLYGEIMPLSEAASVCRWALRNQVDPRSKQVSDIPHFVNVRLRSSR